jgi:hypothetical protein
VHAATAKALNELASGRQFVGMATSDGAVHSVGLRPARRSELESAVSSFRSVAPDGIEVHIAASGVKGAAGGGRIASDLLLGIGLDPRRSGGSPSFEDMGIPEEWQPVICVRPACYDFGHHALTGAENPNSLLFADRPDIQDFLIDRQWAVGTVDQVANKLRIVVSDAELEGIWIRLIPSPRIDDPGTSSTGSPPSHRRWAQRSCPGGRRNQMSPSRSTQAWVAVI